MAASGTYRLRRDSITQLSNVSLYGDATTTGFLLIGVKGNNIFPKNKFRIDYDFYLYTFPSDFWGIGYENGNNNANKSSYDRLETILRIDWLARLHKDLYGGISTGFNWVKGSDFTKIELLEGEAREVISTSIGATLVYDSRDFITNAAKGVYIKVNQRFFPKFLGNKKRLLAPISFSIIITAYGKERSLLLTYMENSITAMYPGICLQLWEGRPVCEDTTKADTETKI